jgi:hypothetical protein
MKKRCAMWLLASVLSASSGLCAGVTAAVGNAPGTNLPHDMVTTFEATGPHPSLGHHANDLGRLVGTWDVEYTDFVKDGKAIHRTGEFIVAWVMDGRAIQDLWIVNPSGTHEDREVYTDLYYFDSKSQTWRASFVDPQSGSILRFKCATVADDRLVLETLDLNNEETRWSFNAIRPDSFVFRDEASSDGGKTWRLRGEDHMKRRAPDPSAQ